MSNNNGSAEKNDGMAGGDRLSDLPESVLLYILSMLPDGKEVVRTSVLSTRWRSLWMSVPVSLDFSFSVGQGEDEDEDDVVDFVTSTHRELHYWISSQKIRKFRIFFDIRDEIFVRDVDSWVYFATRLAKVEDFSLEFHSQYELPQFAYKSTSLRNLSLHSCTVNPSGTVNWSCLISLSVNNLELTEDLMKKVLSGCPNLECLQLEFFWGIRRLEISNVKLRKLTINSFETDEGYGWLEIVAPYIQVLQLAGSCRGMRLRNMASLVSAVLDVFDLDFGDGDKSKEESSCLKGLLHSLAHADNLEIGSWCIKYMSTLALEGWQSQPSSGRFLKINTNLKELDFPGICSFLKNSSHLQTLVIDWYNPDLKLQLPFHITDRESRRFETHKFDCPLLHLKTIKFINLVGPLSENKFVLPLVKYFLENAIVLEKFEIAGRCRGSAMSQVHVKIEQELLRFPRSSPHASIVFSYQSPPDLD